MGAEASSEAVMSNNSVPIWRESDPSDHSTIREFACGICRVVVSVQVLMRGKGQRD